GRRADWLSTLGAHFRTRVAGSRTYGGRWPREGDAGSPEEGLASQANPCFRNQARATTDMPIQLTINGTKRDFDGDASRPLLEVLREDYGLTGTKYGCGEGSCRACTVLVDGKAETSCLLSVREVEGKSIQTIEGLAK